MSQSSLVTERVWADPSNYTQGRQDIIRGIVIHHAASTNFNSIGQVFQQPGRNGSAHYGVGGSKIAQYVKEEDTAWHCGNWLGNSATIGIETTNSTGAPDWRVSDDSIKTLIKLVADIAKRNNLGKLWLNPDADYPTLSGHRDWYGSATYCPGDYLYSKLQYIADKANEINFPPAKAELKWTKLSKPATYAANKDCYLYDFAGTTASSVTKVKDFHKGDLIDIFGKCENKTIGKTYLVTEYSYTNKIARGFRPEDLDLYTPTEYVDDDAPAEVVVPVDNTNGEIENNPRGLTDNELAKAVKDIEKVGENAKKEGVMIPMSNKVYDVLKIVAIIILPLISAVYAGLSKIWGFGFGTEIDQTIQIIVAAINVILGAALVKSSSDYAKEQGKK